MVLAPGTILQRIYLKERIKNIRPGTFIEVGVGEGMLSHLLCDYGWHGVGYDLNENALESAKKKNQHYIDKKQYEIKNENWLYSKSDAQVDLIISSMVLEHLDAKEEKLYFAKCKNMLNHNGRIIILVPSSTKHWGIEDEIAGHYRRYTHAYLTSLTSDLGWRLIKIVGLTYPLSNWLHPISNWLVQKSESEKLKLNMKEKTIKSSSRNVLFKTQYPVIFKLLLNEFVLYPFHVLQKFFSTHPNCLITYVECLPMQSSEST